MSKVFVIDTEKRPLTPIHPGRARCLLTEGKAAVWRRFPFTIILKVALPSLQLQPLRLKLDPGSKTTGMTIVNDTTGQVVWAAELTHRGEQVRKNLADRRVHRHGRRQRTTRYRKPRFANRQRKQEWLSPSQLSRIRNVIIWVERLRRYAPITALSQELARFDTQLMQNPEISGVQYQHGELAGYNIREYLMEKWERCCAYCGKTAESLEIEHLIPKSRGGSDRVSNLTLACHDCNQRKGNQSAAEFGYSHLQAQAKVPMKDAATMNTTRWTLYERLKTIGLPVEIGTSATTKWNRTRRNLPKTHWVDAACVGASTPDVLQCDEVSVLLISATGRQRRQMCLVDKYGFPRTRAKEHRIIHGIQTGDIVRAVVPRGKRAGCHTGKVAVKASGYFTIATKTGLVPDIAYRYCTVLHRSDGYSYQEGGSGFLSTTGRA